MLESAGPDQNQEELLNLLGMDSVETVFQILQHRNDLLQAPGESSEPPEPSSKSQSLSQRPIDDMGLDEDFLDQLKKQGLRLPNEPRGHDDRYKGYMLGVKLNHDVTMNERVSGQKTYHDVCLLWLFDHLGIRGTSRPAILQTSVPRDSSGFCQRSGGLGTVGV